MAWTPSGAFDMHERAEIAGMDSPAQGLYLGMKAAIVADAERDAGFRDGLGRALRLALAEGERFFAEHMLAGFGRCRHLSEMAAWRRRQDHGVDAAIGQDRIEVRGEREVMCLGEGFDIG